MENIDIIKIILNYILPLVLGTMIGFLSTKVKIVEKKIKQ